jgi:chlorite dismutase
MAEPKVEAPPGGSRSLNHYGVFAFTPAFWEVQGQDRKRIGTDLAAGLREVAQRVHGYRIFPARAQGDLLLWSALPADEGPAPRAFFDRFARCLGRFRRYLAPVDTLWGFTRPSDYASGRSAQEIDPFEQARKPYLVIYPFAKTTEWYLMSRDARQGMMNEHIRIGREYSDITQLLLYSTGLQDQEFVVSYETEDLARFSNLVAALRDTEARKYTLRDTPIYTASHQQLEALFDIPEGS